MKKVILFVLMSSYAMAEWYSLTDLNCVFMNGAVISYSEKNPTVANQQFGYLSKKYQTDSKVVFSETNGKKDMSWRLSDPLTGSYSLHFSLDNKTVQLNKKLTGVAVTMTAFVPAMVPVWYPVGTQAVIARGQCSMVMNTYKY